MPVLQFNSAASAAITRRAWHGECCTCFVLRSFVPASCSPAHSTGKQGNGHGQQPNSTRLPVVFIAARCCSCRRGVARQVWRVLQSKVAVWREQWGACLPNNRLASHELHSSPSAHHALNRLITSGSKAIKQGRKWFAAAAAGALCGSFPRARTRAALSRQIALIYLCNRVLGEMRLKAKRGQSSSAQSPQ